MERDTEGVGGGKFWSGKGRVTRGVIYEGALAMMDFYLNPSTWYARFCCKASVCHV